MFYPQFDKLSEDDRKILLNISEVSNIIFDTNIWEDDHQACFNMMIDNIKISFWCVNSDYMFPISRLQYTTDGLQKLKELIQVEEYLRQEAM